MEVFLVWEADEEGWGVQSIWKTKEAALNEVHRLKQNSKVPSIDYWVDESVVEE